MKKMIISLAMMLTMTLAVTAGPIVKAAPASKTNVEFKGDTIVVNDGDKSVTVSGLPELQKVRDRINEALDDTLTAGDGTSFEIDGHKGELAPEDIKEISAQWGEVAKQICYASIAGLLALILLILLFRFLNRRNKYRVIEKAIENNYPLDELSLTDVKRSAIYVQQPVVASMPVSSTSQATAAQAGQVPVGTPLPGATPDNPVVMTTMVNWRALMPAIRVFGWGLFLLLFGIFVAGGSDPFTVIGWALMFVGVCKGFILYKEQKALQEAAMRAQQMQPRQPVREGVPMPSPMDDDYKEDDSNTYQPY
jgi:hypothetical protein